MILIKHPTLRSERFVPEADLDRWLRAGWLHGLTDDQQRRLDEIQAEVDARTCPTCGASGDEPCRTASGRVAERPHAARPD